MDLAERKITLLPSLQGKTTAVLEDMQLQNPIYRIFKISELHLFNNCNIPPSAMPVAENWSSWKKGVAEKVFRQVDGLVEEIFSSKMIPTPSIQALLNKKPEALKAALNAFEQNATSSLANQEKMDFVSVILHLHFHPELKSCLPPSLKTCLARIEQTKTFDIAVQEAARIGFQQASEYVTQTGADIQESSDEDTEVNQMEETAPILKSLKKDNTASYMQITFHHPDGTRSEPIAITQEKLFVENCSAVSAHKGDKFNLRLQRLLHQYAYTAPMQSIGNGLNYALGTSLFSIAAKNQILNVDIREQKDGSTKVEYTYRGALASASQECELERGVITGKFSYQLNRDESAGWKIEGPVFEPLSYSTE
jgi:hypothetical protein